jgi:hypothetical protein
MSEPYAALAQVTIERAALISYLDARPRMASQWSDWSRIGGRWHGFSWEEDLPAVLVKADRWLGESYRHAVRTVLEASEAPALGRCSYDEPSRRFTFGTLTLSRNLNDIAFFFAAARGLAAYLRDAGSGFAVVHNYLSDNEHGTLAVMDLGADGYSCFLDAPAHQQHVADATAVWDDIYQAYAKLGHLGIFDELERLR